MAPLIIPGDVPLIIKTKKYRVNDILIFKKEDKLIAHRAIYIPQSTSYCITKGDNNLKSDGKIPIDKILGKVEKIKRNGKILELNHVYLTQSTSYFYHTKRVVKALNKKIPFVILKGLPLHLKCFGKPPKRLYLDIDILIRKGDYKIINKILKAKGFNKAKSNILQINFIKKTRSFPVIIDLHLQPAIGFTKLEKINRLVPNLKEYGDSLFDNIDSYSLDKTSYPLLNPENQIVYLFLHFYHHNFGSIQRLEFINSIIKKVKPDWKNVSKIINDFEFNNFVYPGILMLKKYYKTRLPNEFVETISPRPFPKLFGIILSRTVSPFNVSFQTTEGVKRLIILLLLSPKNILAKISVLFSKETVGYYFPTIKSFFLKRLR